jgi:dCMP deaminase
MSQHIWHCRFLELAQLVSTWSKDPSTRVGAVAVRDKRVLSTGYNGLPRGVADLSERLTDRNTKLLMTSHAETNVIVSAAHHGVSLDGATVYVTLWPCSSCAAQLINAGVSQVVIPEQPIPDRWAQSFSLAMTMFTEAGVQLLQIPCTDS